MVGAGSSSIGGRGLTRTGPPMGDGSAEGGTGTARSASASIGVKGTWGLIGSTPKTDAVTDPTSRTATTTLGRS